MRREAACEWCGEKLGYDVGGPGSEPDSCGKRECDRGLRDMMGQLDAEARERAAEDDYERYR